MNEYRPIYYIIQASAYPVAAARRHTCSSWGRPKLRKRQCHISVPITLWLAGLHVHYPVWQNHICTASWLWKQTQRIALHNKPISRTLPGKRGLRRVVLVGTSAAHSGHRFFLKVASTTLIMQVKPKIFKYRISTAYVNGSIAILMHPRVVGSLLCSVPLSWRNVDNVWLRSRLWIPLRAFIGYFCACRMPF